MPVESDNADPYFDVEKDERKTDSEQLRVDINGYDKLFALSTKYADIFTKRIHDLFPDAIEDVSAAIELAPTCSSYYFNRAAVKLKLGNYAEAIIDYDKNMALVDQPNSSHYFARGLAKASLGKHVEAIIDYDEIIDRKVADKASWYEFCYFFRGLANHQLGKFWEATLDYNEAIKSGLWYAPAYYSRGLSMYLLEHEQAFEDYHKAIELDPHYPVTFNNHGNSTSQSDQHTEAIEHYEKSMRSKPNYVWLVQYLADASSAFLMQIHRKVKARQK